MDGDDDILREALDALEMPREGVGRWLDGLERFYEKHGGERHYAECLGLVAALRRLRRVGHPCRPGGEG
jgi:hypothetical protein